jgi:hypothetical protein
VNPGISVFPDFHVQAESAISYPVGKDLIKRFFDENPAKEMVKCPLMFQAQARREPHCSIG